MRLPDLSRLAATGASSSQSDDAAALAAIRARVEDTAGIANRAELPLGAPQPSDAVCIRSTTPVCKARPPQLVVELDGAFSGLNHIKMLWSGWEHDTQAFACALADALNHSAHEDEHRSAYAIEQTAYPKRFLDAFGTWDNQLVAFQRLYRAERQLADGEPLPAAAIEGLKQIRKDVWDALSGRWAEDARFTHAVAIVPALAHFNREGTLATIEMPRLHARTRLCVIEYDCERRVVAVRTGGRRELPLPATGALNLTLAPVDFEPRSATGGWTAWAAYLAGGESRGTAS